MQPVAGVLYLYCSVGYRVIALNIVYKFSMIRRFPQQQHLLRFYFNTKSLVTSK